MKFVINAKLLKVFEEYTLTDYSVDPTKENITYQKIISENLVIV